MSAKLFQSQFLGYGWINQSIHYMVFCRQKLPNKELSWSKSEKVYTRLYLNKLESIMRALSDAFPTGHRAMANPTLQLHFGCGRASPPGSHSHNWPSRRMQNFLFKIGQKSYVFANKDPKTTFDAWMILHQPVLSFKCNDFFKNGQFEGDIIFCHLKITGTSTRCSKPCSPHRGQWCEKRTHVMTSLWDGGQYGEESIGLILGLSPPMRAGVTL